MALCGDGDGVYLSADATGTWQLCLLSYPHAPVMELKGRMLDEEAGRDPEKEEMDEPNLEGLKKKYSWWLTGHQDKKSATSPEKADLDDTVTLFEGKNTHV